jgi:hypothetical protein
MSTLTINKECPEYFKALKSCFEDFNYLSFELNNFAGSDRILDKFNLLHKKFKKQNRADLVLPNHKK